VGQRRRKPDAPKRPPHLLLIAALWVAGAAVYSNSFSADLVFDSKRLILSDSRIQSATAENARLVWTEDYYFRTGSSALYRPLSTLSFLFNYSVLGDGAQPAGYHWSNFAIHAANTAIVYLLGLLIFGEAAPAFAMAALWSLHPVLTEAVTNVAGRADLLAAFGVLAGLLCYVRGWPALLALASAIAVCSKESGIVLLGLIPLYDLAFNRKAHWRSRIVAYVAAALPAAVYLVMRARVLAHVSSRVISFIDNPLLDSGFFTARMTAVKVLVKYVVLMIWPVHLSCDYSYNQIPLLGPGAYLAFVLWLAIAAAAVFAWRRIRPVFFLIGFFAVTIAPVSNLAVLIGSIMAERFLYLPSIAFGGIFVWTIRRFASRYFVASVLVIGVACGARTYVRNSDWNNERSLWTADVRTSSDSCKTHQNLAGIYLNQSPPDISAATRELEQSLAILDPLPPAHNSHSVYATAGFCFRAQGRLQQAMATLLRGRQIDEAWNSAVQQQNRRDGKTISDVGTPQLYLELARVYRALGQPTQAIEPLHRGRAIDPEPEFFEELSQTYSAMHQPDQAAVSLLEGLTVDRTQVRLASALVQLYRQTAPDTCALITDPRGVTPNVNCPIVHAQLCTASANVRLMYLDMRDPDSAGAVTQQAIRTLGCDASLFR
jgi:hypothetical protein